MHVLMHIFIHITVHVKAINDSYRDRKLQENFFIIFSYMREVES